MPKISRNAPCPCGSGKKYKKCCLSKDQAKPSSQMRDTQKESLNSQQKSKKKPKWQPISMLPTISNAIDGMLESAKEQYNTLMIAKEKPHVLDDDTVDRILKVFGEQNDMLWVWEEQLSRWTKEASNANQRDEIERLKKQLQELVNTDKSIVSIAEYIKENTIEKVLAKDDLELGIEAMQGKF